MTRITKIVSLITAISAAVIPILAANEVVTERFAVVGLQVIGAVCIVFHIGDATTNSAAKAGDILTPASPQVATAAAPADDTQVPFTATAGATRVYPSPDGAPFAPPDTPASPGDTPVPPIPPAA